MTKPLLLCTLLALAAPASAQERIILPDEEAPMPEHPMPRGGTALTMKAVTVEGQNQLRGRFGSAWAVAEVREQAGRTCDAAGMRMVYFAPGRTDAQGRTEFAAVCQ